VEGTFAQLGKSMVWQGHGYWVHGLFSLASQYNPLGSRSTLIRMEAHREKFRKKQGKKDN
jgi:hypothetical protein